MWQLLNPLPLIYIGYESVPANLIQVLTIFHVAMPSTIVDLMVINRVDDIVLCLITSVFVSGLNIVLDTIVQKIFSSCS